MASPATIAEAYAAAFPESRAWSEAEVALLLEQSGSFVSAVDPAFAIGRVAGPVVELITLICPLSHRRQGYGAACLTSFEADALSRGAEESFLEVAEDNSAAIMLYRRSGYDMVGIRPRYYLRADGLRVDARILRKALLRPPNQRRIG
ncbi:MAG: GNAT family N-acetyltransferase [Pseudomonadota bacterium]